MKVSSFNVFLVVGTGTVNIEDQVMNLNITETIFGDLQGVMEITDGTATLENLITAQNRIIIEFKYLKTTIKQEFYVNGVTSVDLSSSLTKKTYVINLKSMNDMKNSMKLVAKSFKGKSTDIITAIHEEFFGANSLSVRTDSVTQGHYIAPNISPKKAIEQIRSRSYDRDMNPFFLFQRLIDNKQSILESLKGIEDQLGLWTIQPSILDRKSTGNKPNSTIGQPESIIVHSDSDNMDYKIGKGVYGKSVNNIDISNSELKKTTYGDYIESTNVVHPIRMDMYTNDVNPLLNSNDYYNICTMQTILSTLFNTRVTAYHCNAIPGIGVGDKINLDLPKNKMNQGTNARFSGAYVISKIIHRINDGHYTQIIEMARS